MTCADSILKQEFGINDEFIKIAKTAEKDLCEEFIKTDEIAEYNQLKILRAFQKHKVSYAHFSETSGYGYDDLGRDTLDKIYADVFGAEDALVRFNIISGTQAIAMCLYGVLRPNDTLLSVCGKPYDTLEEVIGIKDGESNNGSLKDFGISYKQVDLLPDGSIDYKNIKSALDGDRLIKAVLIQRSKGYQWRPSVDIAEINKIIETVKAVNENIVCIVDNCYGEFVEPKEPCSVGADLAVGSLIKNPGGGLAPSGGYIVGKHQYVEAVSYRYTAPGLGKHIGASLGFNKSLYQGFYMAPYIVSQSIKSALFCAKIFEILGYSVSPASNDKRADIIQAVKFEDEQSLIKFCQTIQKNSPIDSHVTAVPWDMPGYSEQVIMAAGGFVQGASIELSADAPIKPPYIAYMQGGLTYGSAKAAILKAAQEINFKA